MSDLVPSHVHMPATSASGLEKVRRLESAARDLDQMQFVTAHLIHGGVYYRTIKMREGAVFTGALIKIATGLIVVGDTDMCVDDGVVIRLIGYNILPGSPGRKVAFYARSDLYMTMIFPTEAMTVEDAQKQFTDEVDLLVPLTEPGRHSIEITGE